MAVGRDPSPEPLPHIPHVEVQVRAYLFLLDPTSSEPDLGAFGDPDRFEVHPFSFHVVARLVVRRRHHAVRLWAFWRIRCFTCSHRQIRDWTFREKRFSGIVLDELPQGLAFGRPPYTERFGDLPLGRTLMEEAVEEVVWENERWGVDPLTRTVR